MPKSRVPKKSKGSSAGKKQNEAKVKKDGKSGKKPSKRAWRKADVEDVEEAMEDERLVAKLKRQAMKGKSTQEEDETDGLFTVDTKGSCEGLSASSRREVARAKIFPAKGPKIGMSAYEEAKISRAGDQMAANRKQKRPSAPGLFDLWSEPTPAERHRSELADDETGAFKIRKKAKPKPVFTPRTMHQKASAAPAVIPAHEGQSVNPEGEAFEDLACMAAAKQLEEEEEAKRHQKHMRPMTLELESTFGAEAVAEMDEEAKVAAYRKLVIKTAEQQPGESDEAFEKRSRLREQKSQAQRNKERKRKIINNQQEQLRTQKKLEKSVGEVGAILKQMKEEEATRKERKEYRLQLRQSRKLEEASAGVMDKTTRLGRHYAQEEALVVPDTTAAQKGLRSMPLKASAVKDRLQSIVRRGLLPAPPEASKSEATRKKSQAKFRKKTKFMSPLLKDNLLLR